VSDGTFRPSGATAWSSYNTPRIWAMVENEDDPESWRQVAALGSMAGLLKDQRSRLEAAKQQLIEAWPPETNKASVVFVELVDNLLSTMQRNKDIADANAGALSQVLEALRQAKADIAPLYQSYLEKSDDWVPGWWDNAEDELDEQARERMRAAESIIAHPDNSIQAPALYEFTPGEYVSKPIGTGGDDGTVTSSGVGGVGAGAAGGFQVPHDPPPVLPSAGAPDPSSGVPAAVRVLLVSSHPLRALLSRPLPSRLRLGPGCRSASRPPDSSSAEAFRVVFRVVLPDREPGAAAADSRRSARARRGVDRAAQAASVEACPGPNQPRRRGFRPDQVSRRAVERRPAGAPAALLLCPLRETAGRQGSTTTE
jgi:hypothetical protein